MSYREKIERYKKHQLTEEETKEVEAEIEKTEAISDYLADRLMDDLDGGVFQRKTVVNRQMQKRRWSRTPPQQKSLKPM